MYHLVACLLASSLALEMTILDTLRKHFDPLLDLHVAIHLHLWWQRTFDGQTGLITLQRGSKRLTARSIQCKAAEADEAAVRAAEPAHHTIIFAQIFGITTSLFLHGNLNYTNKRW